MVRRRGRELTTPERDGSFPFPTPPERDGSFPTPEEAPTLGAAAEIRSWTTARQTRESEREHTPADTMRENRWCGATTRQESFAVTVWQAWESKG